MTASDWVTEDRVPVYDEHVLVRRDPKTGRLTETPVTEALLVKIANARNARIERSGNLAPIKIGHTRFDLPEYAKARWSPTVGYADRFEVGTHPEDGRPTMYARLHFRPTERVGEEDLTAEEIMRRFPHRSIEAPHDLDSIDAVCLLEPGNTPAREMGLLRMAAAADPDVSTLEPPMDPAGDRCNELIAALMTVLEQFAGGGPAAAPPGAAETPAQYAAAAGPAAADPPEMEKVRMQRDQDAIKLSKYEARMKSVEEELRVTKLKYQAKEDQARLTQLLAENYDFDLGKELERVTMLRDKAGAAVAEAHFDTIKTCYQRSGATAFTTGFTFPDPPPQAGSPYAETAELKAAEAHMLGHPGMMFNEALAAVKNGK